MAEPAIALREHPQIIELFTVLEQNGLHQQKDEVQALVSYIDGMEDKLSRMVDEMTAMRKEVDQLHDRSIQARCTFLMNEAENKVHQVSSMVSTAKNIKYTVTPTLGGHQKNNPKLIYAIDFDVTPHQLRHTYITNLLYAGVDPKTVQYLAGHENSKTTMDIYAQVKYNKPEELLSVVNAAFRQ